jgi:thymidine kinase
VTFSENAANMGKIIIISGLDATFQRKGFESILELIPLAEKVKKLAAICRQCSFNASYTFRTAQSDQLELIGGESMYKPLCRECFIEESKKLNGETQGKKVKFFDVDEVSKDNLRDQRKMSDGNNENQSSAGSSGASSPNKEQEIRFD